MNMKFGDVLKEYRRAAGMTQRELADRAGLDFSYISKIENNRIPPPAADTIVQICKILNVQPDELLSLTGKIPTQMKSDVITSKSAFRFLREAQEMKLNDDEWLEMSKSLKKLRKQK